MIALAGDVLGSQLAYEIGRRWSPWVLKVIVPQSQRVRFESLSGRFTSLIPLTIIRFALLSAQDYVSYIAGVWKLSRVTFFLSTIIISATYLTTIMFLISLGQLPLW